MLSGILLIEVVTKVTFCTIERPKLQREGMGQGLQRWNCLTECRSIVTLTYCPQPGAHFHPFAISQWAPFYKALRVFGMTKSFRSYLPEQDLLLPPTGPLGDRVDLRNRRAGPTSLSSAHGGEDFDLRLLMWDCSPPAACSGGW
jgi:hypothetical protein